MNRMNYHHLFYFWSVAKEGGVARASERLNVTQPSISSQLAQFEAAIGQPLFDRVGRSMVLTEVGRDVFEYAEEIFSIGRELTQYLRGRATGKGLRLHVGVADVLPKLLVTEFLKPIFHLDVPVKLTCHEDKPERLLNELALHAIDLVLMAGPLPSKPAPGIFSYLLVESGMSVFGARSLTEQHSGAFPEILNGAPFLVSEGHPAFRHDLDRWSEAQNIWPEIRAEISDSALLKTFGAEGVGFFMAPTIMEQVVCRQYGVDVVGRIDELRERYYLLSAQRKVNHPGLKSILDNARTMTQGANEPR